MLARVTNLRYMINLEFNSWLYRDVCFNELELEMLNRIKGQKISKRFFSGRGFAKTTNENTSHASKNEFIRSFFESILGLTVSFRN